MKAEITCPSPQSSLLSGWLDWLQMLSGLALALFVLAHMCFVGSILFGAGALNAVAVFFEDTGLAQVGGPFLFLLLLFHGLLAARKMPFTTKSQILFWRQARMMRHRDTWFWVVQVVSGLLILVLGSIHMWNILSDLPITAAKGAAELQNGLWLFFYLLLIPAAALHACIGLYRIGVKWGVVTRATRNKILKYIYIIMGLYLAVELLNMLRFYFLQS